MGMTEQPNDNHQSVSPTPQPELSCYRYSAAPSATWRVFFFGSVVLAGILVLFWQFHTELNSLESRLFMETGSGDRLRAMDQQMGALRDRLHGLMADSVEIRLKSLERNIAAGKVSGDDLIVFQTLQNDLRSLESYERASGSSGLGSAAREHPRYQAAGLSAGAMLANGDMLREISRLRTLLYICVTGLLAAGGLVAGRYWISSRHPSALNKPAGDSPRLLNRRRPSGHT